MCSVYLKDSEKVVSISSEHLEPITPTKNNKVRDKGMWGHWAAAKDCDPMCRVIPAPPPGEGDPG